MSVFVIKLGLELAGSDLADGERDSLFLKRLVRELGLNGQLTGAVRDDVDEQIAAVNILEKFRHGGVKH